MPNCVDTSGGNNETQNETESELKFLISTYRFFNPRIPLHEFKKKIDYFNFHFYFICL